MENSMGDRIRNLRIRLNMTQEELGKKLNLQKSAIAKYENGRVENIKRSTIPKLAEALDTTPSYLMGWKEENLNTKEVLTLESEADTIDYQEIIGLIQKLDLETFELIRSLLLKLTAED